MFDKRRRAAVGSLALLLLTAPACELGGDGSGACVSDAVEFSFGLRVYCYSDWDQDDCASYNRQQVNGAEWSFYEGQSCEDRDLEEGSNPWP